MKLWQEALLGLGIWIAFLGLGILRSFFCPKPRTKTPPGPFDDCPRVPDVPAPPPPPPPPKGLTRLPPPPRGGE